MKLTKKPPLPQILIAFISFIACIFFLLVSYLANGIPGLATTVMALIFIGMLVALVILSVKRRTCREAARYADMAHWYSSILDSVPLPISVQDKNHNLQFINKAMEDYVGKKRCEVIGQSCYHNKNFAECNTTNCAVAAMKRGLAQSKYVHKASTYHVNASELKNSNGVLVGYTEVIQDITQLEELRLVAEEESRAKSNFLANMSHEMRTPLNAIIGMTEIGKHSATNSRKDYALDRIEESSTFLLGVINDVLDMSKIEADRLELSPVNFNLDRMLQKVSTVIGCRFSEKQQEFCVNIDPNVPNNLFGDDQRLSQVIINLLTNASKFTGEHGRIDMDLACGGRAADGCRLLVAIKDTGIGIGKAEQEKLFSAFTQADNGTSRKFGGTGLGLAISKRLVEMMGGKLWLESEPGVGSKFSFTVKLELSHENTVCERHADKPSCKDGNCSIFDGKRLLLAEDIEINREIVLTLLENTGANIECVHNGEMALNKVIANPDTYDLVLMDVQMPVMDGLEATKRIRALEDQRCKSIPIIALTANVFKEDVETCLAEGMNGHLAKPLNYAEMITTLKNYL